MQIYTRIHIPLLGALTAVGAGVHMLIQEAARRRERGPRGRSTGARRSTCCASPSRSTSPSVARTPSRRGRWPASRSWSSRPCAGALTPVSVVACSAAALVALVVYEIRLGLAGQAPSP